MRMELSPNKLLAARPPAARHHLGTVFLPPGTCLSGISLGGGWVASARFGVASSDRPQVWAPFKRRRKYEVVNEILPTRSCAWARLHFAEEKFMSSGSRDSRRKFFHLRDALLVLDRLWI